MKKNLIKLMLSLFLIVIAFESFTQISNTQTTIYLANPSASLCSSPAAGSYTLSISYFDPSSVTMTPTASYSATVSYSGTTIVLTVPTAILPTMAIDGYDFTTTNGNFSLSGNSLTVFFLQRQVSLIGSKLP